MIAPSTTGRAALGDLSDLANRQPSEHRGRVSDLGSIRQQLLEDGPDPVAPGSDVRGAICPTPKVTSSPLRLDVAARPADELAVANDGVRDGGEKDPPLPLVDDLDKENALVSVAKGPLGVESLPNPLVVFIGLFYITLYTQY